MTAVLRISSSLCSVVDWTHNATHPSSHASEAAHIHIVVLGWLACIYDLEVVNELLNLRATLRHGSQNVQGCAVRVLTKKLRVICL